MVYQVPREQLFVAPKVQGFILLRALLYWGACLALTSLAVLAWRIFVAPHEPLLQQLREHSSYLGPALVAGLILLPVIIVDVVRLSNKFFGPLARLRASLQQLGTGQRVMPIHFRLGDFWQEFAAEYNDLIERVEQLEHDTAERRMSPVSISET